MATVVSRTQIERSVASCPQVERQMRAVAVGLEAEVRQTTFGRAVQTGELARSWRTEGRYRDHGRDHPLQQRRRCRQHHHP